jgi:hypothetical protein
LAFFIEIPSHQVEVMADARMRLSRFGRPVSRRDAI